MGEKRPNPRERARILIEAMSEEPQTITELSRKTGMKWGTVWDYLRLIQSCQWYPRIKPEREGKRMELWKREWK